MPRKPRANRFLLTDIEFESHEMYLGEREKLPHLRSKCRWYVMEKKQLIQL